MLPRLLSFAAGASLVLLVATAALWVRQPPGRWHVPATRLRVEAQSHGLVVYRPPVPAGRPAWAALRQAVSRIRNDQLQWEVYFRSASTDEFQVSWPAPREGTPTASLMPLRVYQSLPSQAVPLLLDALDDPDRFAAAHAILSQQRLGFRPWAVDFHWDDYPLRGSGTFEGLPAELTLPRSTAPSADATVNLVGGVRYDSHIDPAQLPAIRELWHRRLDQQAWAASYGSLAAALLVCPALWLASTAARRARHRSKRQRRICVF